MERLTTATEILPRSTQAAVVFTRGRNLSLDDEGKGHTGYWKVSPEREFEKIVLYLREEGQPENKVYLADFVGHEGPNEEGRYLLNFANAALVGETGSNWYEFTGMETNTPVVYMEQEEAMALSFDLDKVRQMLRLVRKRFPDWGGFDDPRFLEDEITYKEAASQKAHELLDAEALQERLEAGDYDDFIGRLESVGQSTNLLYLSHPSSGDLRILYQEALDKESFCHEMYALLHGPPPVRERLERYLDYVRAHDLPNNWTFPTYFLFLLYPATEMFIKPMATRWSVELMNEKGSFPWKPSGEAYGSIRNLFHELQDALADYGAEDMIDVQSFAWVAYREAQKEDEVLADPFAGMFEDWEEAEWVFDFFEQTACMVGFAEHLDKRFTTTLRHNDRTLRMNFGNWMLLDFASERREIELALLDQSVPAGYDLVPWGEPFANSKRDVTVYRMPLALAREMPEELRRAYEESMAYIGERFADWKGSPWRHAHRPEIFEAFFDEEKREQLLSEGTGTEALAETRYWRITLPEELRTKTEEGQRITLNVWEICRQEGSAVIDFGDDKSNFQVQRFMEIQPGDRVVAFLRNKTIGGVGTVISGYDEQLFAERTADQDFFEGKFWFRIGVDWQPHLLDVDALPESVANKFIHQTVLELTEGEFETVVNKIEQPYGEEDFLAATHLTSEEMEELRAMLHDKRQLILYGPPGTGKTYVAQHLARLLTGFADPPAQRLEIVQFHPAYGYEDFIEGIRPRSEPAGDGHFMVNYPVEAGAFRRFCREAEEVDGPCVFIIDEINRGNIARIFGELMLLLEYRDQRVTLPYSGKPFSIPENVYIAGTMNTADRSIALVDFALRRRFHFFRFDANSDLFRRWVKRQPGLLERLPYLPELYRRLSQEAIDDPNYAIGPSYFMDPNLTETRLEQIWRRSIIPYLEEYYFEQADGVDPWRWESGEMRAIRVRGTVE